MVFRGLPSYCKSFPANFHYVSVTEMADSVLGLLRYSTGKIIVKYHINLLSYRCPTILHSGMQVAGAGYSHFLGYLHG